MKATAYRVAILCFAGLWVTSEFAYAGSSSPTTTSTTSASAVKTYHDGSIRDLDAIGNRNVGCGRGLGNWYSLDKQIAMGKQYAQQVLSTSKMINDPVV